MSFHAEVAKMKASRWLSENVTFVDPDGVEIDRELLRADQSEQSEAESTEIVEETTPSDQSEDADA